MSISMEDNPLFQLWAGEPAGRLFMADGIHFCIFKCHASLRSAVLTRSTLGLLYCYNKHIIIFIRRDLAASAASHWPAQLADGSLFSDANLNKHVSRWRDGQYYLSLYWCLKSISCRRRNFTLCEICTYERWTLRADRVNCKLGMRQILTISHN